MNSVKKFFLLITLTAFLLPLFVGCGQLQNYNTLNKIKESKKFVVATEAAYAPFEYVENGKIIGYGPDILHEIFKDSDIEVEQVDMTFAALFPALEEKKVDAIITALNVLPDRQERYYMLSPIAKDVFITMTLTDRKSEFTNEDDLSGKKVGMNANSSLHTWANEKNEELIKSGKEPMEILPYTSQPDSFLDLKNGRIDAILVTEITSLQATKNNPDTYETAFILDNERYYAWAVRKNDKELAEFINNKIIELKKNGKLAELQEKWFGTTWNLQE